MYSTPMMFPLDLDGKLHSIQDENGNTIGTGTREVCEVLMHLIAKGTSNANDARRVIPHRSNVRAAISI
jgi:hypothetical protein